MKKPVVHYVYYMMGVPGRHILVRNSPYGLEIACGIPSWWVSMIPQPRNKAATNIKDNVTCRKCKRTKIYKGKLSVKR